ncbi:MAG TPA: sigma-54 dependent transcriptional regulator [Dissulfurispiraceae bacterium]|nr:sigma-54 dependent transcriptional regulator [Dissulfurispiraceae bacterium]
MEKTTCRILIVDDEQSFLLLMSNILIDAGYTVQGASSPDAALRLLDGFRPNLIITDLKMPKMDGITFMDKAREILPDADFIMVTAYAAVDTAIAALKKGALEYITKPLKDPEELRIAVAKIAERQSLIAENRQLRSDLFGALPPLDVIFAGMEPILRDIEDVAPTDATVIMYGETGTGKSLIAKVLHHLSGRPGMFVEINCAAIPEQLLESELFGFEKGAFTGAAQQKKGRFEIAHEGTIFLDEIAELGSGLQAKLLKVLQDKTFERLGSLISLRTNARIVAATNRDLKELSAEKKFREDLYYRLSVFPITIPPLRDRSTRIPAIADYLAGSVAARLGKPVRPLPQSAYQMLAQYDWPGNIRELENLIERSIIISRGPELLIPLLAGAAQTDQPLQAACGDMKSMERGAIINALKQTSGNRRKAAEILGISLRSLQYKIKDYAIED